MFRGGANGVNIKWIVWCEIWCNNANGQLRTPMQCETHTVTVCISGALSQDRLSSEKPHGCIGHMLVQLPFWEVQALNYALLLQGHFGWKTCHVFIHLHRSTPLLWFQVCIVCGSAIEALPDHLWSSIYYHFNYPSLVTLKYGPTPITYSRSSCVFRWKRSTPSKIIHIDQNEFQSCSTRSLHVMQPTWGGDHWNWKTALGTCPCSTFRLSSPADLTY